MWINLAQHREYLQALVLEYFNIGVLEPES